MTDQERHVPHTQGRYGTYQGNADAEESSAQSHVVNESENGRRSRKWYSPRRLLHMSKYALGIFLILCVTVIWVASSEFIQYLFGDLNFNKPYFMTYFNTCGFSFWNLGYLFSATWRVPWDDTRQVQKMYIEDPLLITDEDEQKDSDEDEQGEPAVNEKGRDDSHESDDARGSHAVSTGGSHISDRRSKGRYAKDEQNIPVNAQLIRPYHEERERKSGQRRRRNYGRLVAAGGAPRALYLPRHSKMVRMYSIKKIWSCAAVFCALWFLANCLFNYSLSFTSVASNTSLSATSALWTLLLSFFLPRYKIGLMKWFAVILTLVGMVLLIYSDKHSVAGNTMAVVSAFFYSAYTFVLKLGLPDDDRYSVGMVFGAVGVLNLLFLWPGILVVQAIGIESFSWPSLGQLWPLVLNALIGTNLSDVLWARSVILTSPVVATLGLSLTTPLAMVVDWWLHGYTYTPEYISGALLLMIGFIVSNLPFYEPK